MPNKLLIVFQSSFPSSATIGTECSNSSMGGSDGHHTNPLRCTNMIVRHEGVGRGASMSTAGSAKLVNSARDKRLSSLSHIDAIIAGDGEA
jgi:hypothetical protein